MRDALWSLLGAVPLWLWHVVTWLGDSALLLPMALMIALWLLVPRRTRPAGLAWVLCFGAMGGCIAISKLAFMGWCLGSARLNFTGFSGHTAIATSVWPLALWLLAVRGGVRWRRGAVLGGWALGAMIGLSRLPIFAHSVFEVASGLALGLAASAAFFWLRRAQPLPRTAWPLVLLTLAMLLTVSEPGVPAPTQGLLESIATWLAGIERACTRDDLLSPLRS